VTSVGLNYCRHTPWHRFVELFQYQAINTQHLQSTSNNQQSSNNIITMKSLIAVLGLLAYVALAFSASLGTEEKLFVTQSDIKGMGQAYHYLVVNEKQIWHVARSACQNMGGDLATITSLETFNRLLEFLKKSFPNNMHYWVGAEKQDKTSEWTWTSGEPLIGAMTSGSTSVHSSSSNGCMVMHPAVKSYVGSPGLCIHNCFSNQHPYICEIHW
jgi:hypothetical protein